jgi:hypothetical protein
MSDCIHCDGDGITGSCSFCFCKAGDRARRKHYLGGHSRAPEQKGPSNPLGSVSGPQAVPPHQEGIRKFDTGATRSAEGDKPDYEGFLSPTALIRFGQYMHKHRKQADGNLRASDNWQKGIPIPQYLKSLFRHFVSTWAAWRSIQPQCEPTDAVLDEQEENLCAILFNAQGMLHEILSVRARRRSNPIDEWMRGGLR